MTETLLSVTRYSTSKSGNPRWKLVTTSGKVLLTGKDSAVGYLVDEDWAGRTVRLALDSGYPGEVIGAEPC